MSLEDLAEWLRCPNCLQPLHATALLTIGCETGHRFDVNKRGYVTLVNAANTTPGDTVEMLTHRARLLDSGAYSPIVDAVADLVPPESRRIVDAGCGTGYYLGKILDHRPDALGLALDRSAAAVRLATRTHDAASGLVADTWRPLPIRDGAADLLLNIFAPRNAQEFARILAPGGVLIAVLPRIEHLRELRNGTQMLRVPDGKPELLKQQLRGGFDLRAQTPVEFTLTLHDGQAELLRDMGPSAHHAHDTVPTAVGSTTVSVDVLQFERR